VTEVPQPIRDVLKDDFTDRGIQQWWDHYREKCPASSEQDALDAAGRLVAYLEAD
jgi:hypothetical protein